MSRIIIDVGDERKKKMNLLVKGKNARFKSYNELIRRLLDSYFESIETKGVQSLKLDTLKKIISPLKEIIPPLIGIIEINIDENGASAYLENNLIATKDNLKDLIFYLWENYKEYELKIEGIELQDFVFATFSNMQCWNMLSIDNHQFPVIPIEIQTQYESVKLLALVDTASSITLLDNSLKELTKSEKLGKRRISTPIGEEESEIFRFDYKLKDKLISCETAFVKFPEAFLKLKIEALLGENLLKHNNLLVLYLKKITCLSDGE